jgi:hypothetical protein
MPSSTMRRRKPPGKDRQAVRAMVVTVVTVIIRTAGQVLQAWIKRGGRL